MGINKELREEGYVIFENLLTKEEINQLRNSIINYFKNGGGFTNAGGYAKPDWIKDPRCEKIKWIMDDDRVDIVLKETIGDDYIFLGHNDIHMDRIVGWHKDRLSGAGKKYETHKPWEIVDGERHEIYKLNIYLQDHSGDGHALVIKERSHLSESDAGKEVILKPKMGDVVLFDQRLTHRGQTKKYKEPRLLISLGFGRPNIFSEEFIAGTKARQDDQNKKYQK